MGMSASASGGGGKARTRAVPQMNVTPLVDVVLVLLIIFMVVTPLLSKQFWLQLPKQDEKAAETPQKNETVVLTVKKDGKLEINGSEVAKAELRDKLARIMAARAEKAVYFDAADDAPYAVTVEAMDLARQGGAKTVAILTKSVLGAPPR
jgi:biopolymer transport protein ExbD/biopolymer transport protein TolR